MNKVEAFKNELRNYHFYINEYKRLNKILNNITEADEVSEGLYIDRMLFEFSDRLQSISNQLDATFTKLTGFKAITYEEHLGSISEELSDELKLELIDRYNLLLAERKTEWVEAKRRLVQQIQRTSNNINYIQSVLDKLPRKIKAVCIDIYCNGFKYDDMVNRYDLYWSASSLYREVYEALKLALK